MDVSYVLGIMMGILFIQGCMLDLLASKVRMRFSGLGYRMQSQSMMRLFFWFPQALFYKSNFWKEADKKQAEINDPVIKKYKLYYELIVFSTIAAILPIVFVF